MRAEREGLRCMMESAPTFLPMQSSQFAPRPASKASPVDSMDSTPGPLLRTDAPNTPKHGVMQTRNGTVVF
jgi:hypothetical protein